MSNKTQMVRSGIVGATLTLFAINVYENVVGNKKRLASRTQAATKAIEAMCDLQIEQNTLLTKRLIDQNIVDAKIDLFTAYCVRAQTKLWTNHATIEEITFELEQRHAEMRVSIEAIVVDSDIMTNEVITAFDSIYLENSAQLLDIQRELG